jgi:putative PIN family toxin of toxin-antitoxin system
MKRVILDTNVLISGIFWNGPPFEILKLWKSGEISLIASPEIIEEYQRVGKELAKKKPRIDLSQILNLVIASAEIYLPAPLPETVCRDPDDDKFIACALHAGADFIISGDRALLKTSGYQGIRVIRPRDFLLLISEA